MILRLVYPLEKPFVRIRGFEEHEIWNPGTWYGVDVAPKRPAVIKNLIASSSGRISHSVKQKTGGGYNFRLNFTKYPGYFMWYAHNSIIPPNDKVFKQGQVIGKSGATGGVTGPHLHFSLMQGSTPKDPDNKNVVKWMEEDEVTELESKVASFIYLYRAILNRHPNATMKKYFLYLAKKGTDPAAWSRNKYLTPLLRDDYVTKVKYENALQYAQDQYEKVSGQRLANHDATTDLLEEEIEGLKDEIKTFKEPKTVKVPRVTKNDSWLIKIWKRLIQSIAR